MTSPQPPRRTIHLARQSTRWSQADSAGGYTMRYITAMRNYLIERWDDGEAVDESLVLLLNHLSSKGFGKSGKGRLRDFLLRATRAAVVAHHQRAAIPPNPLIEQMAVDDPIWLGHWQDCLLERVWRSLERSEHANPGNVLFRVLQAAEGHPDESDSALASRILQADSSKLTPTQFQKTLRAARREFAQLLADEVTDTLESPTPDDVKIELTQLGLLHRVEPFSKA